MTDTDAIADTLISDHLLAKGYTSTFKCFEDDNNAERVGKLKSDSFVEETLHAIDKLNVSKLISLWESWSIRMFGGLSGESHRLAKQYENDVYKLFLVRCVQKKEHLRSNEFFHKMSAHTVNNPVWTEWFSFPFHPNPQDSPIFKKYFDKQWREIFIISLHNFMSIVAHKAQPSQLGQMLQQIQLRQQDTGPGVFEEELIDDFAVIAQCTGPIRQSQSKTSLKSLFRSLTSGSKRSTD